MTSNIAMAGIISAIQTEREDGSKAENSKMMK